MVKKVKRLDTHEPNKKHDPLLILISRIATIFMAGSVKVVKRNEIPKPPYLLLSSHHSFVDFPVAIKATHPHAPYWVSTIEEFITRNKLFRYLGVIPKRKFTNDPKSALLMMDVVKNKKKILIIYPEARYSFCGRNERLDEGLGRFAKMANIPVVYLNCHGHYLREPQWGDRKVRKVKPYITEMTTIVSKYEVESLSLEEINEKIKEAFVYDEEAYQEKKHILVNYPKRALGLHNILYQCPHCLKESVMSSTDLELKCDSCGATYFLEENGKLTCKTSEAKFTRVSDWYYWEKENVKKQVLDGTYHFEDEVRVERLEGEKVGFVPMEGKFKLVHSIDDGFIVTGDNGFKYERSSLMSYAVHVEFNYLGRGGCLDLATIDDSYFVYPINRTKELTKIHFAVEHIYDLLKSKVKE